VATETNARTDRWWAPRHSDRPAKPTLLRQATRISTEKSTRRLAYFDEVTVGIAEEHAGALTMRSHESALFAWVRRARDGSGRTRKDRNSATSAWRSSLQPSSCWASCWVPKPFQA
jgi:hypothetical protein